MLVIFWQARTTYKDFKLRNKPVVAVGTINGNYIIPENDERKGKQVGWDSTKNIFSCEGKPIEVLGLAIKATIKNFGPEPALDVKPTVLLEVGQNSISTKDEAFKNTMLMPGQDTFVTTTISKVDLYDAFVNKRRISIKYTFKFNDLTKRKKAFEYNSEVLVIDQGELKIRMIEGSFIY
jgi:hypothetical protein